MPEYSHYSDEKNPMPIFAECFIDNISNLKEGDYLVLQKHFTQEDGPVSGMTTVWNITRVTKKCVYIEHPHYADGFKQIRLVWKDVDGQKHPESLYKGYLNNDSWNYTFYRYVKKDDMNLDRFHLSDQLIRG